MEIRAAGRSALLIDVGTADSDRVEAWRAALWHRREAGDFEAVDIVAGARTVLLDGLRDPTALAARLPGWAPPIGARPAGDRFIEIPIRYRGADLDSIAAHWRLTRNAAIARHLATEFRVAFCGFAPGFAYLSGLPTDAAVSRLASPRTRVPAGSVALADLYCGIYPTESPGGWQLIGHTDVTLFDINRASPALLTPGTRVRFVRADT